MKTEKSAFPKLITGIVIGGVTALSLYKLVKYLKYRQQQHKISYRTNKDVFLIDTAEKWQDFWEVIRTQNVQVIGIDCEWVSYSQGPVSILQLATPKGSCALIRLSRMPENIPDSLKELMGDKSILKVGVAPVDDGQKLLRDYGIVVRGCVDLRHIYKRVRGFYNCDSMGLQGLAKGILGIDLNKDPSIRKGNWEADTLSEKQIEYAALDALVGVDIFVQLVMVKIIGSKSDFSEEKIENYTSDGKFIPTTRSLCQGIVDVAFKWKTDKSHVKSGNVRPSDNDSDSAQNTSSSARNINCGKESRAYVVRQRPLYYNCSLQAPDGQLLCTCDIRKAEWYISKNLADKISDDPYTLRLKFEPAGRPIAEDDYYLFEKENICVVCGSSTNLIKKQVIPKEYRRFFPTSLKDHSSHDVLLMCVSCHQISTQSDINLRYQLAEECGAPIDQGSTVRVHTDHDLQKVRSAARALLNKKVNIPTSRKEELTKTIVDFYGNTKLSDDLLQEASEMDFKTVNDNYCPHGKQVIRYIRRNGGIFNFEKKWRQHFLDTMKSQYLPSKWSVDHRHERTHLYS